jgi:hypothetical protein
MAKAFKTITAVPAEKNLSQLGDYPILRELGVMREISLIDTTIRSIPGATNINPLFNAYIREFIKLSAATEARYKELHKKFIDLGYPVGTANNYAMKEAMEYAQLHIGLIKARYPILNDINTLTTALARTPMKIV